MLRLPTLFLANAAEVRDTMVNVLSGNYEWLGDTELRRLVFGVRLAGPPQNLAPPSGPPGKS